MEVQIYNFWDNDRFEIDDCTHKTVVIVYPTDCVRCALMYQYRKLSVSDVPSNSLFLKIFKEETQHKYKIIKKKINHYSTGIVLEDTNNGHQEAQ